MYWYYSLSSAGDAEREECNTLQSRVHSLMRFEQDRMRPRVRVHALRHRRRIGRVWKFAASFSARYRFKTCGTCVFEAKYEKIFQFHFLCNRQCAQKRRKFIIARISVLLGPANSDEFDLNSYKSDPVRMDFSRAKAFEIPQFQPQSVRLHVLSALFSTSSVCARKTFQQPNLPHRPNSLSLHCFFKPSVLRVY